MTQESKKDDEAVFEINHYYYLVDRCFKGIGKNYIPVRVIDKIDNKSINFINLLDENKFEISADNEYLLLHRRLYFSEKLLENIGFEKIMQGNNIEYLLEIIDYDLFESNAFLLLIIKGHTNKHKKIFFEKRLIDSCDNFNGNYPFKNIIKSGRELNRVEKLFNELYPNNFEKTDNLVKSLELEF